MKVVQKMMGITTKTSKSNEKIHSLESQLQSEDLSKNQKKNLKKKLRKEREKENEGLKQEGSVLAENHE